MKINSTDRVRNNVLQRVEEERTIVKIMKSNRIGHISRRNCLLKHVIEGKAEGKDRSDEKTRKKT